MGGYKNIEVLVINDGSNDNTESIVNKIVGQDSRVQVISQQNLGVGVAKSIGVQKSIGEYIAFCDSDDWFDANYLKEHGFFATNYNRR